MRKIIFRGKTEYGVWYYGSHIHRTRFYGSVVDEHFILYDGEFHSDFYTAEQVLPDTVGQFTGLLDKNCIRIFEGDVVDVDGVVYVCRWDECNSEFSLVNDKESFGIAFVFPYVEVIGNIYDNPELLT